MLHYIKCFLDIVAQYSGSLLSLASDMYSLRKRAACRPDFPSVKLNC